MSAIFVSITKAVLPSDQLSCVIQAMVQTKPLACYCTFWRRQQALCSQSLRKVTGIAQAAVPVKMYRVTEAIQFSTEIRSRQIIDGKRSSSPEFRTSFR